VTRIRFESAFGLGGCIVSRQEVGYGVATVSRIDKIVGLFCRILSLL